ncbi:MAG: NAD(P)/FAD-dependent oxidoreductase [Pseudohongiellaceae bacterium]
MVQQYDVIVIGAGAAGLMCAIEAGRRGRRVLLLEHAKRAGKKILMSGGGRCNFTNLHTTPEDFLSRNPHFCKSALSRYTPWDFIALVERHGIAWHEKKLGQLFCDHRSSDIVNMLLRECEQAGVELRLRCPVYAVHREKGFRLETGQGTAACESLVVATGGLSIPTMGATGFGHDLARQFGLDVLPLRAGLVPFTLDGESLSWSRELSGVSLDITASCGVSFRENLLWTHRGLSGPAVLQLSSYWLPGQEVAFDLLPGLDVREVIDEARRERPRIQLRTLLSEHLPRRLVELWSDRRWTDRRVADLSAADIRQVSEALQPWRLKPAGTEGYRTAEVTLGGVNTDELSSRTMESTKVPGLYFIGEVVDVTGHLGGFNFQWAWASAVAAGQDV